MKKTMIAVAGAGLLAAACTSTGNVERNAAAGAAIGAVAGAVIGNNVGGESAATGAALGAAIGGTAGASACSRQSSPWRPASPHRSPAWRRAGQPQAWRPVRRCRRSSGLSFGWLVDRH